MKRYIYLAFLILPQTVMAASECNQLQPMTLELQKMVGDNQDAAGSALGDVRRLLEDASDNKIKPEQFATKASQVGDLENISYDQKSILDEKFSQLLQLLEKCKSK